MGVNILDMGRGSDGARRRDFSGSQEGDANQKGRTEVRPRTPNQMLGSGLETLDKNLWIGLTQGLAEANRCLPNEGQSQEKQGDNR